MPKTVNHAERRATFIAASWDLIADEGLSAATLRRVAAAVGVTTGSLTHYFNDRDALIVEALRTAHFTAGSRMISAMAEETDPRQRLITVLNEALPLDQNRRREWKVWLAFWAQAVSSSELAAENERRYQEWRELLEDLVSQIVDKSDRVALEVDKLIALIDGLGLRLTISGLDEEHIHPERRRGEILVRSSVAALGKDVSQ